MVPPGVSKRCSHRITAQVPLVSRSTSASDTLPALTPTYPNASRSGGKKREHIRISGYYEGLPHLKVGFCQRSETNKTARYSCPKGETDASGRNGHVHDVTPLEHRQSRHALHART
jgi:hypothetical protein